MANKQCLKPWAIARQLPSLKWVIIARYRSCSDANGHFLLLRQRVPNMQFKVVFDLLNCKKSLAQTAVDSSPRLIEQVHFNGLKSREVQGLVLLRGLDLLARGFNLWRVSGLVQNLRRYGCGISLTNPGSPEKGMSERFITLTKLQVLWKRVFLD